MKYESRKRRKTDQMQTIHFLQSNERRKREVDRENEKGNKNTTINNKHMEKNCLLSFNEAINYGTTNRIEKKI